MTLRVCSADSHFFRPDHFFLESNFSLQGGQVSTPTSIQQPTRNNFLLGLPTPLFGKLTLFSKFPPIAVKAVPGLNSSPPPTQSCSLGPPSLFLSLLAINFLSPHGHQVFSCSGLFYAPLLCSPIPPPLVSPGVAFLSFCGRSPWARELVFFFHSLFPFKNSFFP